MKADHHLPGAALLIVEDDAATRHLIQTYLEAHGYQVAEAGSAREALRAWDARRPDLIVLDLGLPDADGLAVIRRVRRDATTPILVLSARGRGGRQGAGPGGRCRRLRDQALRLGRAARPGGGPPAPRRRARRPTPRAGWWAAPSSSTWAATP